MDFYNAFLTNRRSDCLATLSKKFKMAGICNCWWFWCLALGTCFSATFPLLTIYVLILHAFTKEVLWLPTFIVVVGTPPALTLVYGPGWKKWNDFSVECAFHLSVCQLAECAIDAPLNVPGTVSNVTTMAFVGWIVSAICHQLRMVPSVAPIAQKRQNNLKLKIRKPFNGQYDALLLTSPKLGFMEMS